MKYFVYILKHNDHVFYVGMTRDPRDRFKQHCTDKSNITYPYIFNILESGQIPEMAIVDAYESRQDARFVESALIRLFLIQKNRLCNDDQNHPKNQIKIPSKVWQRSAKMPNGYSRHIDKLKQNSLIESHIKRFDEFFSEP